MVGLSADVCGGSMCALYGRVWLSLSVLDAGELSIPGLMDILGSSEKLGHKNKKKKKKPYNEETTYRFLSKKTVYIR